MRLTIAAAAALLFLSLPGLAGAQSTPQTTAQPASADAAALAEPDRAMVPVWPKSNVTLPEDQQPIETSFALGQIEGIEPKLTAGVSGNGYARQVAVEGQRIGQVLVLSVAKDGREETISADGLTAQFDAAETSELFPEKSLTVEGSKTALIAALEKLSTPGEKEESEVKRDDSQSSSVSGNASGNKLASGYTSPARATIEETKKEPEITYEITTDGCKVRIDTAQAKAIVQSKTRTLSDGVFKEETECSDSGTSYPLARSYLACRDEVDIEAKTAWPQYGTYYTDDQGETHTVGQSCTRDEEHPFTITESEAQCPIDLDFETGTATPQAALMYTDRTGATVQARGCADSTQAAPITMSRDAASCPLRHDYEAGKSYELAMWTYVRGGLTYQASPCLETGRTFAHEKIYTNAAGDDICTPVINTSAGTVTLQSRVRITIDGASSFISECTPDTTTQAILSTTDGCMDPSKWTHDIAAAVSYGQERFYYLKGAAQVPVTSCQTSKVTYPHQHEITGWQYHDDGLYAYPLRTVSILIGSTPYTIATSQVLPGEQQVVYVPADQTSIDKPTGESTYEGCNAYRLTRTYERWERPDETVYEKAAGAGTPQGPVNVCSETVIDSRQMRSGITCTVSPWSCTGNGEDQTCYEQVSLQYYSATVNKTQFKNVETGVVVSTGCTFSGTWNGAIGTGVPSYAERVAYCPPTPELGTRSTQTLFVPPCPF